MISPKGFLREVMLRAKVALCDVRYRRSVARIRQEVAASGRRIRVVFYIIDIAKWKCQTLYDLMKASADFDPVVAVSISPYNMVSRHADTAEAALAEREAYFRAKGCACVRVAKGFPVTYDDLVGLRPDVVFLQQPWSLPKVYDPFRLSRFALTYYVPYYVQVNLVPDVECAMPFHRLHYGYFTQSAAWNEAIANAVSGIPHACRFLPCGQPALDRLGNESGKNRTKDCVIYAPHFSFCHPKNNNLSGFGTFEWNGREILSYAKSHREFNWVFKPHPALRDKLVGSGEMTPAEVEDYFAAWADIGEIALGGDYQDLFLRARAMITDCCSFLAEFGATGSPVIRLVSKAQLVKLHELSEGYVKTYYQVRDLDEMHATFAMVLERGEDPARQRRVEAVKKAGLLGVNAAENILAYMRQTLCPKAADGSSAEMNAFRAEI